MCDNKIEINTEGGAVITGGTFIGTEFVGQKHVHAHEPQKRPLADSEQRDKNVLERLLAATDVDGNRIFTTQTQWYAVYRVFSELRGYPKEMKAFCRAMEDLGMKEVRPAVNYDSLKKAGVPAMLETTKVTQWKSCLSSAQGAPRKQIVTAMKLIESLEEER